MIFSKKRNLIRTLPDFFHIIFATDMISRKYIMRKKVLIITGLILISFISCTKHRRKENIVKIVKEWTGKEIWKKIMNESDSAFIRKSEFVFVFQSKKRDEKELQEILRSNVFRYPVFIDKENQFNAINKFPSNPNYQCFLLDKENKVVMVGNPSLITGIWTLYRKIISERESTERLSQVKSTKKGGGNVTV